MRRPILLLLTTLAAACATAPAPPATTPAPANPGPSSVAPPPPAADAAGMVDHLGDSDATAVEVPRDAQNEGVDFQNQWMFKRFGKFRKLHYAMAHAGDRRYDVITIELPDHSEHTVFFDVTENWNTWRPQVEKH